MLPQLFMGVFSQLFYAFSYQCVTNMPVIIDMEEGEARSSAPLAVLWEGCSPRYLAIGLEFKALIIPILW